MTEIDDRAAEIADQDQTARVDKLIAYCLTLSTKQNHGHEGQDKVNGILTVLNDSF